MTDSKTACGEDDDLTSSRHSQVARQPPRAEAAGRAVYRPSPLVRLQLMAKFRDELAILRTARDARMLRRLEEIAM